MCKDCEVEKESEERAKAMSDPARLAHHQHLGEEMRFLKTHEWRTAYYAILVFAGIVALMEMFKKNNGEIALGFKIVIFILLAIFAVIQCVIQENHRAGIKRARRDMNYIDIELKIYTGREPRERDLRDHLYTKSIWAAIVLGAVLTGYFVWIV